MYDHRIKSKHGIVEVTLTAMRDDEGITEFSASDVATRLRHHTTQMVSSLLKFTKGIQKKEGKYTGKYGFVPGEKIEVEDNVQTRKSRWG
jgi:hypothetical protein